MTSCQALFSATITNRVIVPNRASRPSSSQIKTPMVSPQASSCIEHLLPSASPPTSSQPTSSPKVAPSTTTPSETSCPQPTTPLPNRPRPRLPGCAAPHREPHHKVPDPRPPSLQRFPRKHPRRISMRLPTRRHNFPLNLPDLRSPPPLPHLLPRILRLPRLHRHARRSR
jgi:hypothetical protein